MYTKPGLFRTAIRDSGEQLFTVHYACESWSHEPLFGSARVVSIALHNLRHGLTRTFSWNLAAERFRIQAEEITKQAEQLEKSIFAEFNDYLARLREESVAVLLTHWAMRDATFGWPLLEHRHQVLNATKLAISDHQLVDFHAELEKEFGKSFAPRPRFLGLAELNGIASKEMMTGGQELSALQEKRFATLDRSVAKKAETMGKLMKLYAARKLKVMGSRRRRTDKPNQHPESPALSSNQMMAVDAARYCGISRASWYRMCAAGLAPAPSRLGRRSLWSEQELRAWIEAKCPPRREWEGRIKGKVSERI